MAVDGAGYEGAPLSPGARLRAARERAGWSVEQVAQRLRLSPAQITALESGQREGLPPAAYVRGYLRNYAQLLGLDPQEFAKVRASAEMSPPVPAASQAPVAPRMRLGPMVYGLLVAGIVAGVMIWHTHARRPAGGHPSGEVVAPVTGLLPPRLTSLTAMRNRSGELRTFPLHAPAKGAPRAHVASTRIPPLHPRPVPARRPLLSVAQGVSPRRPVLRVKVPPGPAPLAVGGHPPVTPVRSQRPRRPPPGAVRAPVTAGASVPQAPVTVPSPGGLVSLPQGRRYVGLRIRASDGPVRVVVRDARGVRLMAGRIANGHRVYLMGRAPFRLTLSRSRGVTVRVGGHVVALPGGRQGHNVRVTVDP
ncbi:helix-turn-helix domain-containing protein [Acidiferrobacter sp.]|uniref:helix-turn-helix domain-containing protein n=1 Tax=Acidiferrobacter sp. TaxID=1872107 RepID=UPI002601F30C|nr:RodZ domain-containing protein [Acidiferrobacter sp.]